MSDAGEQRRRRLKALKEKANKSIKFRNYRPQDAAIRDQAGSGESTSAPGKGDKGVSRDLVDRCGDSVVRWRLSSASHCLGFDSHGVKSEYMMIPRDCLFCVQQVQVVCITEYRRQEGVQQYSWTFICLLLSVSCMPRRVPSAKGIAVPLETPTCIYCPQYRWGFRCLRYT